MHMSVFEDSRMYVFMYVFMHVKQTYVCIAEEVTEGHSSDYDNVATKCMHNLATKCMQTS
jgi:hypothetical protein